MTKEKVLFVESDSDSDFELPDISFSRISTPKSSVSVAVWPITNRPTSNVTMSTSGPVVVPVTTSSNTCDQQMQQNIHISAGTPTVTFNSSSIQCCICMDRDRDSFLIFSCGHTFCMVCSIAQEWGGGVTENVHNLQADNYRGRADQTMRKKLQMAATRLKGQIFSSIFVRL
ncbi:uncharacterized protein LOC128555251 isoform X2 [Mercenaria mercenaria]|uniref:uncharacterized protein LOC128555251 isoform X2 n=1 Tax=Mercenaria mercenaria TaxID=6596 RepID=UPI00234F4870|nr:uncharacterized protein LOC128555251 isoform X2 [Mercenaria mercenaria]